MDLTCMRTRKDIKSPELIGSMGTKGEARSGGDRNGGKWKKIYSSIKAV